MSNECVEIGRMLGAMINAPEKFVIHIQKQNKKYPSKENLSQGQV